MGVTGQIYQIALRYPRIAAPVLRTCLQHLRVPDRLEWVVDSLKRELPLSWERREVTLDDGSRLIIDSRSAVGREVYYSGSYEPELCRTLEKWLRPGMVCIDAGANIGEFTLRAAKLVGTTGSVHAFEASPGTFEELQENVRINSASNITINNVALDATAGTVEFFVSRGIASGSSSLTPAHDFSGTSVRVPSATLDDYVRDARLPHVDVMKMDIEGAELQAFHGAPRLLGGDHAPILIFEHHPIAAARFGVSRDDVVRYLEGFGYRLTQIGLSAGAVQGAENVPENIVALPARLQ